MKTYFYHDEKLILLKITAARRPSKATRPKRGTWVIYEAMDGTWQMPCFPEITWGTLQTLTYLGCGDTQRTAK